MEKQTVLLSVILMSFVIFLLVFFAHPKNYYRWVLHEDYIEESYR